MVVEVEKSFPRGGKDVASNYETKRFEKPLFNREANNSDTNLSKTSKEKFSVLNVMRKSNTKFHDQRQKNAEFHENKQVVDRSLKSFENAQKLNCEVNGSDTISPKTSKDESRKLNLKRKMDTGFLKQLLKKAKNEDVVDLSLKDLSAGMVILGCICEVTPLELKVNLPGKCIGYVSAMDISDEYNTYLKGILDGKEKTPLELMDIFKEGQFVLTRIVNVSSTKKIILTLNPNRVMSDFPCASLKENLILPSSVCCVEKHGYIMNCGIRNVRAFLKKNHASRYQELWNNGRELGIGQVLRCLVTNCKPVDEYFNVQLEADPEIVAHTNISLGSSLGSIIPGMGFQVSVLKETSSGVVVQFANDLIGCIHRNYLNPHHRKCDFGALIYAKVLYIKPVTEQVFFSTLGGQRPLNYERGQVLDQASVHSVDGGTVVVKLDKNNTYGYITSEDLDMHRTEYDEAFAKIAKIKYPIGSFKRCKILNYDYMVQKFICTFKKEKIFIKHPKNSKIAPGMTVKCLIISKDDNSLILKFGGLHGCVNRMHWSDKRVKDDTFQQGQKVRAKILTSDPYELTLKHSLLNSKYPILTECINARKNIAYDGVVTQLSLSGVLVKFYGKLMSFVNYKVLTTKYQHYIGQVVECFFKSQCIVHIQPKLKHERNDIISEDKCSRGKESSKEENMTLEVGRPYIVHVIHVSDDGLNVQHNNTGAVGWIPSTQLTDSPQMASLLCQTYQNGDQLYAYCLKSNKNILFTISPTFIKFFQSPSFAKLRKRKHLASKKIIVAPSWVVELRANEIVVAVPRQEGEHYFTVFRTDVCDGIVENLFDIGIELNQTLMVHIEDSFGSCKLSLLLKRKLLTETSVCQAGVMLLKDFMESQRRILSFLKTKGDPLGDIQVGSCVEGFVDTVSALGAVIKLNNGVRAVVMPVNYGGFEMTENARVEGTVVFIDVVNKCVEISLSETVKVLFSSLKKQNLDQEKQLEKEKYCKIFVARHDIIMGVIESNSSAHLVLIPSRWHINDLLPSPSIECGEGGKVNVKIQNDGMGIAVPTQFDDFERDRIPMKGKRYKKMKRWVKAFEKEEEEEEDEVSENVRMKTRSMTAEENDKIKLMCGEDVDKEEENPLSERKLKKKKNTPESIAFGEEEEKPLSERKLKEKKNTSESIAFDKEEEKPLSERKLRKKKNTPENIAFNINLKLSRKKKKIYKTCNKQVFLNSHETDTVDQQQGVDIRNDSLVDSRTVVRILCGETKSNDGKGQKEVSLETVLNFDATDVSKDKLLIEANKEKNESSHSIESNMNEAAEEGDKHRKRKRTKRAKIQSEANEAAGQTEKCLNVNAGFVWNATFDHLSQINSQRTDDADSSSDEETKVVLNTKKKQRLTMAEKRELARQEEERLRKIEERLLEAEKNPQVADDYDRLVMSAPNNSQNWIKYMAFHLEATEVEKARAVAQRALKTISFREEQEKLNIWMALLNLENLFGTQESLQKVFDEAIKMNDAYKVYMQTLNMYSLTKRFDELDKIIQIVTKKYKGEKNTWLEAGMACIKCGEIEKSRQLMQRALKTVDPKDHVEILTRFALMENEWGESPRAEALMEHVLTTYPKRVDVWCVYVDMLVKSKKFDIARQVLDRAVIQKLPAAKMKSLFKKYIQFEQNHGTPKKVEEIREMAKQYVENLIS